MWLKKKKLQREIKRNRETRKQWQRQAGYFSIQWSGKTSVNRPEWSKRENTADPRGKASRRRTGKQPTAGNKFVLFEEPGQLVRKDKIPKGYGLYIISLKRLQISTISYHLDYSILLTAFPIYSCSSPIHYPHYIKNTNLWQPLPPEEALERFHTPAYYHLHSKLRFIHATAYYPKVKVM